MLLSERFARERGATVKSFLLCRERLRVERLWTVGQCFSSRWFGKLRLVSCHLLATVNRVTCMIM